MAVGENTRSEVRLVDPEFMPDITLVDIDSGNDPLLAKLADALYRWRFGLVVLSPVLIAVITYTIVDQQNPPDPTEITADRPTSAIEPLITGVAGPTSRTGAAPAIAGKPHSNPSTTVVLETEAEPGSATETEQGNESDHPATSQTTSPPSTDSKATVTQVVAGPTTITPEGPPGPSTTSPASTTTTPKTSTTTVQQTTTTETPTTTSPSSCTVSVSNPDVDLLSSADGNGTDLLHIPVGTYQVITSLGSPQVNWYQIDVGGTVGWVTFNGVVSGSYTCS